MVSKEWQVNYIIMVTGEVTYSEGKQGMIRPL